MGTFKGEIMNERRVWEMCRMAVFEESEGKKDIQIASYYQRDYVGLGLLSNLFQITIAYFIILAAIIIYQLDFLIEHFDELNYAALAAGLIIAWFLMVGIYSVIVFTIRRIKYARAKRKVEDYYEDLTDLYEQLSEEKRRGGVNSYE